MAISPELQRLGLLSGGRQARQPAQAAQPVPGEGEVQSEQSLLSQIGSGAMSALGVVGNALDLPGSMVRDVLVWDNPFDQILTPFSHENRATGRDVLARNVLTSPFFTPNKETGMSGWIDDPAEGFQDIAGFALEMAMDPLAWISGGLSKAPGALAKTAAAKVVPTRGWRGLLDKAGNALNAIDPGYQLGKAFAGSAQKIFSPNRMRTVKQVEEFLRELEGTGGLPAGYGAAEGADHYNAMAGAYAKLWKKAKKGRTVDQFFQEKFNEFEWMKREDFLRTREGRDILGQAPKLKHIMPTYKGGEEDILRREIAPTFFSKLHRTLDESKIGKVGQEQFQATMKKAGVKDEELEWAELGGLFEGRKSVSKEELKDWINDHAVELEETILSSNRGVYRLSDPNNINPDGTPFIWGEGVNEDVVWANANASIRQSHSTVEADDIIRRLIQEDPGADELRYADRTTPGGENHREVLMRLPKNLTRDELYNLSYKMQNDLYKKYGDGWRNKATVQESLAADAPETAAELGNYKRNYLSAHWDDPNVIAHIRMQDRIGPNGEKILHVDEIQSDWHQAGRDRARELAVGKVGAPNEIKGDSPAAQAWRDQWDEVVRENTVLNEGYAYPIDMPRYNEWTATNNGTKGRGFHEGHSGWDIKDEYGDFQYDIFAERQGFALEEGIARSKESIPAIDPHAVPNAPFKKTWHELALKRVMREAAEGGYDKISINSGESVIDLAMGGVESGINKFYNEVYPNTLNNLVKKHGGRVQKNIKVESAEFGWEWVLKPVDSPVAIESLADIAKGQRAAGFTGVALDINNIEYDMRRGLSLEEAWGNLFRRSDDIGGAGRTARLLGSEVIVKSGTRSVHTLDITPKMRESLLYDGQPLYQSQARGAGGQGDVPDGMVRLYRSEAIPEQGTPVSDWVKDSPEFKKTLDATGRWWTPHIEEAEWYSKLHKNDGLKSRMVYQDVPREVAEASTVKNLSSEIKGFSRRPDKEVFLPKEYVGKGKEFDGKVKQLPTDTPEFKPEDVAIANATSRSSGAVGAKAVVPRLVESAVSGSESILDFGAGKDAAHAQLLSDKGLNVTAYDFGSNVKQGLHDPDALSRQYDIVYASNVINVQNSDKMLASTLDQIRAATAPNGKVILNLPQSPRKGAWSGVNREDLAKLEREMKTRFEVVERKGEVFTATKPIKAAGQGATDTPEFLNWFGNWIDDPAKASKVVDAGGRPLRVFHGTGNPDLGVGAAKAHNQEIKKGISEWDAYDKLRPEMDRLAKEAIAKKQGAKNQFSDEVTNATSKRNPHYVLGNPEDYDFTSAESLAKSIYRQSSREAADSMWSSGVFNEVDGNVFTSISSETFNRIRKSHSAWSEAEKAHSAINRGPKGRRPSLKDLKSEDPAFNTGLFGANDEGYLSAGTYFTSSAEEASGYANTTRTGTGGVIPVHLNLRNPYIKGVTEDLAFEKIFSEKLTGARNRVRSRGGDVDEYSRAASVARRDALIQAGYDGEIRRVSEAGGSRSFVSDEYVAFHDTQIKSIHNSGKYDPLKPDILNQGARGAVEFAADGRATITAFKGEADFSTLIHETGHIFRRSLGEVDPELLAKAGEALGIERGAKWTVAAEESFAEQFESYIKNGKTTNKNLQVAFDRYSEWMTDVYKDMPDPEAVSPLLKQVFDGMLANPKNKMLGKIASTRAGAAALAVAHKARLMGRQAFDHRYGDAITDATQETAFSATALKAVLDQEIAEEFLPVVEETFRLAANELNVDPLEFVDVTGKLIRDALEGKKGAIESLPGNLPMVVGRLRGYRDRILERAQAAGLRMGALEDKMAEWMSREMSEAIKAYHGGGIGGSGGGPGAISSLRHQGRRKQIYKDSLTNAIDRALSDTKGHDMIDEGASVEEVAAYLKDKHSAEIMTDAKVMDEGAQNFKMWRSNNDEPVFMNSNDLGKMTKDKEVRVRDGKDVEVEVYRVIDEDGIILEEFEHVMEDRFMLLAEDMKDMKIYSLTGGLFGNVFSNIQSGFGAASRSITNAEATVDVLSMGVQSKILTAAPSPRGPGSAVPLVKPTLLRNLLDDSSFAVLDPAQLYDKLAFNNPDLVKAWTAALEEGEELDLAKHFGGMQIDTEVATDFKRVWEFNGVRPKDVGVKGAINNAFRSMTALFKVGVLTHPGRYERDVVSGQIQNIIEKMFSLTSAVAAKRALFNEADEVFLEIPEVVAYMSKHGLEPNAKNATKAVRQMYASWRGHSSSYQRDLDNFSTALDAGNDVESMMNVLPGTGQTGIWDAIKEVGATTVGRRREPGVGILDAYLNPNRIAGFNQSTRTTNPIVQAGDIVGKHADDWNRLTGFIELMRKGNSAEDAMKAVNRVQLNYDPRTFTPTEQQLKIIFPFYSFMSRELGYVSSTLLNDPAGRLGQLIRLGRHQVDEDTFLPEEVKKGGAIPWGGVQEDGTQNYLTGLGLMFEDTLTQIAPSSSSEFLRKIISEANPILKGTGEWAFGKSSFMGDSMGGQDLADLDPILGRILTNWGLQAPLPNKRASPVFGSPATEFIIANSPASRILGNFKTLSDTRKSWPEAAINVLTGMKITSVSPEKQRQGVRRIADARARELGASAFETIHISDELIEAAGEGTKAQAELQSTKLLRAIWASQDRKKKRLGDYEKGLPHTKAQKTNHKEAVVRGIKPGTAEYQNYVFGGKLSDLLKEAQGN